MGPYWGRQSPSRVLGVCTCQECHTGLTWNDRPKSVAVWYCGPCAEEHFMSLDQVLDEIGAK